MDAIRYFIYTILKGSGLNTDLGRRYLMKTLEVIAKDEIFTISDDETMDIKYLNKYIAKHQQLNGSRYKS